jgi:hypothetical protein
LNFLSTLCTQQIQSLMDLINSGWVIATNSWYSFSPASLASSLRFFRISPILQATFRAV